MAKARYDRKVRGQRKQVSRKFILSEPVKESWRTFLVAYARSTRELDRRLQEAGHIPLDVYDVLVTLEYQADGRLRLKDLAERIVSSRSGLSRLVDRLEDKGYVRRERCARDRRGQFAVLTDEGRAARFAAWSVLEPAIQDLWGELVTADHARELTELFTAVCERANPRLGASHIAETGQD